MIDMKKQKIVILGAGVGGLAAGWFLACTGQYDVTLVERAPVIGGHCASFQHNGFVLDYGPHKMYSVIPGVLDELRNLMGDRLLTHEKRNSIYLQGHLLDYPLRMGQLARALGIGQALYMGTTYGQAMLRNVIDGSEPQSYAKYIQRRFGRGAYELVFEPLASKIWGDPDSLHPEMARARIPTSNATELILKLMGLKEEAADTNAEFFHYPRRGFGDFPTALAEQIEQHGGRILTQAEPHQITIAGSRVTSVHVQVDGTARKLPCDYLVSSIPLPILGRLIYGDREPAFNRAVTGLQFRHLILVYLFIDRPQVLEDHWIFFPERQFLFSRIFEQKRMSPELGPPDRTVICCDFTCSEGDDIWRASDQELANRCADDLAKAGFIEGRHAVQSHLVKRSRNFYPRYDQAYAEKMQTVSRWLQRIENLLCTGRIGMYNYNNSDHCIDMGRFIADRLVRDMPPRQIWQELEQRVATYKIVD